MVFTSIAHLINKELLKSCHESMDKDKAVGIDGVTKEPILLAEQKKPEKELLLGRFLGNAIECIPTCKAENLREYLWIDVE